MNSLIKKEYFDLLNKLNWSNKLKNQGTDIYFYIDETDPKAIKLFAAISKNQKILLIEKSYSGSWKPKCLSGFFNLEEYLVELLSEQKYEADITDLIKSHIFKLE